MIRIYLAPVINTVPGGWKSAVVPYTAGTDTTVIAYHARGYLNWSLTYVDGASEVHAQIQSDAEIRLVPLWDESGNYLPMSATVADIAAEHRTTITKVTQWRVLDRLST